MAMNPDDAEAMIRSDDPAEVELGIGMLRDRAEAEPGNASAWFRFGGALDYSDREAAAMDAYQRVIDLGVDRLEPEDRPRLHIQAGSTLRNLKRLDEARELLESGRRQFPDNRAIVAFLALVEVSAGNDRRAVDLLFEALLAPDDGSIDDYRRALTWYANEIRSDQRS
jgi:tetratricopeptide (TPR) repeat protein